jgi:peptidylprolyl isomerase
MVWAAVVLAACSRGSGSPAATPTVAGPTPSYTEPTPYPTAGIPELRGEVKTTADGLQYIDRDIGGGRAIQAGDEVSVVFTAWLEDGGFLPFSKTDRASPFTFVVGKHSIIEGLDEGVLTMHFGGKRRLIVPPSLAFGDQGLGSGLTEIVPPKATLIFDVEVLAAGP